MNIKPIRSSSLSYRFYVLYLVQASRRHATSERIPWNMEFYAKIIMTLITNYFISVKARTLNTPYSDISKEVCKWLRVCAIDCEN
jgi:hypothetical protein